jgi:hypothetical protein
VLRVRHVVASRRYRTEVTPVISLVNQGGLPRIAGAGSEARQGSTMV